MPEWHTRICFICGTGVMFHILLKIVCIMLPFILFYCEGLKYAHSVEVFDHDYFRQLAKVDLDARVSNLAVRISTYLEKLQAARITGE